MSHALNLVRQTWTTADRLKSRLFPKRKATLLPSVWAEELMAKRFGCLLICQPCTWKYGDGIKRFGYLKHPDITIAGAACDFCKQTYDLLPSWMKEEHRYPSRQDYANEMARFGVRGAPHAHDRRFAPKEG